jgi:soluble lytic murein transglycosylase-like protein
LIVAGLSLARAHPSTEPAFPGPPTPVPLGPSVQEWIANELSAYQTGLAPFELREVARAIEEESARYGLTRELILAVMRTESGFYNWARSSAGALGLMQIMPATGEILATELDLAWEGPRTLFDPVINVRLGVVYLAQMHARYGNLKPALTAYNRGPAAVDRRLRRGHALPAEYSNRILTALDAPTAP